MRRPDYVVDVVRAMYDWGADAELGKLLPEGFRNPFLRRGRNVSTTAVVSIGEPDITVDMAIAFLEACDVYQLRLFALLTIYGLRASEPCLLFHEHLHADWVNVCCLPELAYFTKGRRDKRLPMIPCLGTLLRTTTVDPPPAGLIYLRRGGMAETSSTPLVGASLKTLATEFQRRCAATGVRTATDRHQVRDQLLHEARAINYDHIVGEFTKIAGSLRWPRSATVKDFRHLFATCLENAGMPEHYRKYLMGQSPGRAAIVTYTHLNEIRQRFDEAVRKTLHPVIDVIIRRAAEVGIAGVNRGEEGRS